MIIEKTNTEYTIYRIPVLVTTSKGNLLACYECRKDYSDWAEIDLKIIKSEDSGETWRTVGFIRGAGNTLNNPVFIVKDETIHFLYCKNYKQLFYCKSENDGETFSLPQNISKDLEREGIEYTVVAVGPGHGIVHNGNLLIPVWFAYNPENPQAHHPSFIATLYSQDDGKHWQVGEIIGKDFFVNPSECALAIAADNKVIISIRNENIISIRNENGDVSHNFRGFAESATGYSNWENIVFRENMRDRVCQGCLFSENGSLYHVNCIGKSRSQLTLKISRDVFKNYKSILVDEIGGYSDIAVKEGIAYILYERNPPTDGLYFKKIDVKTLMND